MWWHYFLTFSIFFSILNRDRAELACIWPNEWKIHVCSKSISFRWSGAASAALTMIRFFMLYCLHTQWDATLAERQHELPALITVRVTNTTRTAHTKRPIRITHPLTTLITSLKRMPNQIPKSTYFSCLSNYYYLLLRARGPFHEWFRFFFLVLHLSVLFFFLFFVFCVFLIFYW